MEIKSDWYNQKHVWVEIGTKEEKVKFLQFVKDRGFTWPGGRDVKPEKDGFNSHFGLSSNNTVGYIPIWIWNIGKTRKEVAVLTLEELFKLKSIFGEV